MSLSRFANIIRILFLPFLLAAAFPLLADDEQQEIMELMKREDYIRPSLMIVSPGEPLYSKGGHIALRMNCPEKDVDYIYEFNAFIPENGNLIAEYLAGSLRGSFVRRYTKDFLDEAMEEKRNVTEIPLLLAPDKEAELWADLDERADEEPGGYPFEPYDHQCSAMILGCIGSAAGDPLWLNAAAKTQGTQRDRLTDFFAASPWTGALWNILLGNDFDRQKDPVFYIYPKNAGEMASAEGICRHVPDYAAESEWQTQGNPLSPQTVFIFLLALSVLLTLLNLKGKAPTAGKIFDSILAVANFAAGCMIWIMMLAAPAPVGSFNPLGLFFIPLSCLFLFRKTRIFAAAYGTIAGTGLLALYPIVPQLHPYSFWVLIAAMTIRCAWHSLSYFKQRKHPKHIK